MRFENEFEVEAPVDKVWSTVLDVEKVAPTVPGAQVLEQTSDTSYKVAIKVKLGPMTMQYKADIEIVEADEATHRSVMKARAKEARGQGTADADVTMQLTEEGGRTKGTIVTDVKVSGRAASMGRGVMQDVAGRMISTFSENLATMLGEGDAPAEEPAASDAAQEATDGPEQTPHAAPREAPSGGSNGDNALDLGSLGGQMALDRLRDPLVLALLALAFLLGRRSRR